MQLSPVLNILGLLVTILAAAMLIPMCVDLYLDLVTGIFLHFLHF